MWDFLGCWRNNNPWLVLHLSPFHFEMNSEIWPQVFYFKICIQQSMKLILRWCSCDTHRPWGSLQTAICSSYNICQGRTGKPGITLLSKRPPCNIRKIKFLWLLRPPDACGHYKVTRLKEKQGRGKIKGTRWSHLTAGEHLTSVYLPYNHRMNALLGAPCARERPCS
jgi:hypothetical protein